MRLYMQGGEETKGKSSGCCCFFGSVVSDADSDADADARIVCHGVDLSDVGLPAGLDRREMDMQIGQPQPSASSSSSSSTTHLP